MADRPRIGIIGSGRLGTALARLLTAAGYEVSVSNRGDKQSLALQLGLLVPGAEAATTDEVVAHAEIVILALPFHAAIELKPEQFAGKIVIDATNYWEPTEGAIPAFNSSGLSSSEFIQRVFKDTTIVKSLNHIAYAELEMARDVSSAPRAVALAGDDQKANDLVATLITAIGLAPVDLGPLAAGAAFQPDTPLFNARLDAQDLREAAIQIV